MRHRHGDTALLAMATASVPGRPAMVPGCPEKFQQALLEQLCPTMVAHYFLLQRVPLEQKPVHEPVGSRETMSDQTLETKVIVVACLVSWWTTRTTLG